MNQSAESCDRIRNTPSLHLVEPSFLVVFISRFRLKLRKIQIKIIAQSLTTHGAQWQNAFLQARRWLKCIKGCLSSFCKGFISWELQGLYTIIRKHCNAYDVRVGSCNVLHRNKWYICHYSAKDLLVHERCNVPQWLFFSNQKYEIQLLQWICG